MGIALDKISKMVSHALRHEPQTYGLELDSEGWVDLVALVDALHIKGLTVSEQDVREMVARSEKKRHQILDGKIRAYYGHSVADKIIKQHCEPPAFLYHGTAKASVSAILQQGLLPMTRQYVHLSKVIETATIVGKRKAGEVVVLTVNALEAHKQGVHFYKEDNGVWLADFIPSEYIEQLGTEN